jgi:hypothetical protein
MVKVSVRQPHLLNVPVTLAGFRQDELPIPGGIDHYRRMSLRVTHQIGIGSHRTKNEGDYLEHFFLSSNLKSCYMLAFLYSVVFLYLSAFIRVHLRLDVFFMRSQEQ